MRRELRLIPRILRCAAQSGAFVARDQCIHANMTAPAQHAINTDVRSAMLPCAWLNGISVQTCYLPLLTDLLQNAYISGIMLIAASFASVSMQFVA